MTQIFDNKKAIPVTLVEAGPCVVIQVKTKATDGYDAVQVGFGHTNHVNKPLTGHYKFLGQFSFVKEFRTDKPEDFKVGDVLKSDVFVEGDKIKVAGITKGQGFQGVVKRHGFAGGPASHGHRHVLRTPGSTGSRFPQHSRKGLRMPGRSGGDNLTIINVKVIKVDNDVIALKGPIPGSRNGLVELKG